MREPAFWYRPPSSISRLLTPLGAIYGAITAQRMVRTGIRADIPVFCIGNYHVGGAGKTPTTLALAKLLRDLGEQRRCQPWLWRRAVRPCSRRSGGAHRGGCRRRAFDDGGTGAGHRRVSVEGAALARAQGATVAA